MTNILVINGGLGGPTGNCARIIEKYLSKHFGDASRVSVTNLTDRHPSMHQLCEYDGFIIFTGTYHHSWSSHLQRFLEEKASYVSGFDAWQGKPVAIVVIGAKIGARDVMARLAGVVNGLGAYIPPQAMMCYTKSFDITHRHEPERGRNLWKLDDLGVVVANLLTAVGSKPEWEHTIITPSKSNDGGTSNRWIG